MFSNMHVIVLLSLAVPHTFFKMTFFKVACTQVRAIKEVHVLADIVTTHPSPSPQQSQAYSTINSHYGGSRFNNYVHFHRLVNVLVNQVPVTTSMVI